MFKLVLYFGQSRRDGKLVTEKQFTEFIREHIAKEYEGFTVQNGLGYWEGKSELSKVVTIIAHEVDNGKLGRIGKAYCDLHDQSCILVERSTVVIEYRS